MFGLFKDKTEKDKDVSKGARARPEPKPAATLMKLEGGDWDLEGGEAQATVQRQGPKTYNGVPLKGDLQGGDSFSITSKADLLSEIADGWGGGQYKATLKSGSGSNREHLGVVKFELPGEPLDGNGNPVGRDEAAKSSRKEPEASDAVTKARERVELARARAEEHRVLTEVGIQDEDDDNIPSLSGVSPHDAGLREELAELRALLNNKTEEERERKREEAERRREEREDRRDQMFLAALEKLGGGGNTSSDSIKAMELVMQSQVEAQKATLTAQTAMQQSIEANRAETSKQITEMTKAMADKSEANMKMVIELVNQGATGREDLLKLLLTEKGKAGREHIEVIKEAMAAAREIHSPSEGPTSTLDVVQSVADRFLGVVEQGLSLRGGKSIDPDEVKGMLRQAAEEVAAEEAGEHRALPAPAEVEEVENDEDDVRKKFDHVLKLVLRSLKPGHEGDRVWLTVAQKTLPKYVLMKFMKANASGDTQQLISIMKEYGSPKLVQAVIKAALHKGKAETGDAAPQAPEGSPEANRPGMAQPPEPRGQVAPEGSPDPAASEQPESPSQPEGDAPKGDEGEKPGEEPEEELVAERVASKKKKGKKRAKKKAGVEKKVVTRARARRGAETSDAPEAKPEAKPETVPEAKPEE